MCKDEARATLQLVPVADLVKAAPQLAVCTTAAELMDLKPDVGAVTIGGNQVGRQHSISDKTNLKVVVKADYVAKVCFVSSTRGSKSSDTLYLSHAATVEDIKRSFFERHKSSVMVAVISASGLQGATEQEQLASIICRDVDGRVLADQDKLPTATCTACSDVGYHAQFFLDVTPPSMQRIHVKKEINVSAAAIDSFVKTPHVLGAWQDQPQEYPPQYAQMHKELHARLQTIIREVPAAITSDPLENAANEFRSIRLEDLNALSVRELKDILASRAIDYRDCCEKSHLVERVSAHAIAGAGAEAGADAGVGSGLEGDGYYLPLVFSHHASELAEAIQSKSFDSLEGTLPEEAASHLLAMRPFVEELIRVQASSEWTNYDTETNHEDGLTLSDIASELMPGKLLESVNKHVSIKDSSELHPA